MASELDNKLNEILGETVEVVETPAETSEQVEVESKEEGVITAESKETQEEEKEGKEPSNSELEDELKNIDPELKEAILNAPLELRESQIKVFKKMRASIDRKHTEFGQEKKLAETTKEFFKLHGLDESKGFDQIKNLVEFEKKLKENPKAVIKNLQEMFKVQDEMSGSDKDIDIDSLTDNELVLYNKITKAEEEAKQAKKEAENFKKIGEKEQQEVILKEINSFRSSIDEDGSLKNPYFDDLLPEMERLSAIYPNDNVEKLYNKALKLNDEIHNKVLEDKRKQSGLLTKRQEEALMKAKSINSQSLKHKTSSSSGVKSLDDILLNILEAA
jgi:hypothetical protein